MSQKVFVIADTHFNHENIIGYCNRPFKDTKEMDEIMIKNWNETVSKNDIVIHLGDLGLGNKEYISSIVKRLNGKKILIFGNHDNWSEQTYRDMGFYTVSKFPIIYNNFYIMSHAPIQMPQLTCYYNCYGHVHNDPNYIDNAFASCYSVERIGYRPKLLFEKN